MVRTGTLRTIFSAHLDRGNGGWRVFWPDVAIARQMRCLHGCPSCTISEKSGMGDRVPPAHQHVVQARQASPPSKRK